MTISHISTYIQSSVHHPTYTVPMPMAGTMHDGPNPGCSRHPQRRHQTGNLFATKPRRNEPNTVETPPHKNEEFLENNLPQWLGGCLGANKQLQKVESDGHIFT
mmetsp:Transcript_102628/g.173931  ORF Transcript_102628/g.173931 Transcript_102628/m.173931 type:complete len:104 (+) Transcript_102628:442-753(+)